MPKAFYRFEVSVIGRSSGKQSSRSVVFASAYRAGEKLHFEREGIEADYSGRKGIVETGILAPDESPDWVLDRNQLWNEVERREVRKDAQLARELLVAFPSQLTPDQRKEALVEFLDAEIISRGMVADYAIHEPSQKGDERNHHAHVLLTMRPLADGAFANKEREWNSPAVLTGWREAWAETLNKAFERHRVTDEKGEVLRADHRSYSDQGLDLEPGVHLGPSVMALERKGIRTERGDLNREARQKSLEMQSLRRQADKIQAEVAKLRLQSGRTLRFIEENDHGHGNDNSLIP